MQPFFFRLLAWARFYIQAKTKYQVHSPFVFQWVTDVLEDERNYYVFGAIEALKRKMMASSTPIEVTDFGAGPGGLLEGKTEPSHRTVSLGKLAARSASDERQGQMLFKMAQLYQPRTMLELGTSLGIGTLYLANGAGSGTRFVSLEGCPRTAEVARMNLRTLNTAWPEVVTGSFEQTLQPTIEGFQSLDFVYFDGNHQKAPTLHYFAACLAKAHDQTVFVFDDVHWSKGMEDAWTEICTHPRVRLTIDCGLYACAFFNPEFKEKQHFQLVPRSWKPWKIF